MKSKAGFTLIEIMVALVILSLMSAAAVAGLNHMIRAREKQEAHQARHVELINAYAVISQDLMYAIESKIEIAPDHIRFSRTLNHGGGHVSPIKIEYAWDSQGIKRLSRGHESELISALDDIKVMILTKDKIWVEHQHHDKTAGPPLALKWVLSDLAVGEVTWSFPIAQ